MTRFSLAIAAALLAAGGTSAQAQLKPAPATSVASTAANKLAIQVNDNVPATMTLALNNAQNVISHYKKLGQTVDVQIVAYGPGLHMFRDDTSPVKQRIATMSLENPNLHFTACGNTQAGMVKAENKDIKLISEAKVAPSGVITLMELQKQGYAYIRP